MESQFTLGSLFTAYASITAFLSLAKQCYHQFTPEQIRDYIDENIKEWFSKQTTSILDPKIFTLLIKDTYYIEDYYGFRHTNSLYQACEAYLSVIRSASTRLEGFLQEDNGGSISFRLVQGEHYVEYVSLDESHKDVKLEWKYTRHNDRGEEDADGRHKLFELSFDHQYKDLVLDAFIPKVVLKKYDELLEMRKDIYLYTYNNSTSFGNWNSAPFKHPFTFNALALDPELKNSIINDLDRFIRRREFYKKIGRAWKRGYLLYGPPGTGKSSLIAAIANYLKFSLYDLQLASIEKDSTLRNLMMSIENKSILVIDDIDCASRLSRNVALSRNPEGCGLSRNVALSRIIDNHKTEHYIYDQVAYTKKTPR